jgi:hypothetical protein
MIETSCRSNPFAGLLCDATQLTDSPKIGTSGIFAPNNTIGPIQEMGGSVLIHKTRVMGPLNGLNVRQQFNNQKQ